MWNCQNLKILKSQNRKKFKIWNYENIKKFYLPPAVVVTVAVEVVEVVVTVDDKLIVEAVAAVVFGNDVDVPESIPWLASHIWPDVKKLVLIWQGGNYYWMWAVRLFVLKLHRSQTPPSSLPTANGPNVITTIDMASKNTIWCQTSADLSHIFLQPIMGYSSSRN